MWRLLLALTLVACADDPAVEDCADACPVGQACSSGDCVLAACDDSTQCPTGFECTNGRCGPPAPSCLSDDDCPAGRCVDGECFANECAEGETRPCETECGMAEQSCSGGVWRPCPARTPNPVELCDDQVDDDCDGLVDEMCQGCEDADERPCETACGEGIETCRFEAWQGCDAPRPGLEQCDGELDEDCDGTVDEGCDDCADGALRPCESMCGTGEERCMANQWVECDALQPVEGECPMAPPECALEDRFEQGEVRLTSAGRISFPRPVWTGTGFGVFWTQRSDNESRTWFRRVSSLGATQSEASDVAPRSVSSAVWNGQGYYVVGVGVGRIGIATLSGLGSAVRDTVLDLRGSQPQAQMAGENILLVYSFEEEIYSARVTPAGEVLGTAERLTQAPGRSMDISLVATDEGFALTFWDERDNPDDPFAPKLYFMRLDQNGRKIGQERRIGDGSGSSLTYTGGEFGVSWSLRRPEQPDAVAFLRLDAMGNPIGELQVLSEAEGTNARDSTLTWDGERWLAVWVQLQGRESDLFAARIGADGLRAGTPEQIVEAAGESNAPVLLWSGTRFGLAWSDTRRRAEDGDAFFAVGPVMCTE